VAYLSCVKDAWCTTDRSYHTANTNIHTIFLHRLLSDYHWGCCIV